MSRYSAKKIKKLHKSKTKVAASVVPEQVIKSGDYKKIIALCAGKANLNKHDTQLYGYALFTGKQLVAALVVLWPLYAKGSTQLQTDYVDIAEQIFQNLELLRTDSVSNEYIPTLYRVAKLLAPNTQAYQLLKKRLYQCLWLQGDFTGLRNLLKSVKTAFSAVHLENLSKLTFRQLQQKSSGNPRADAGYMLTGAATFLLRHPQYHQDIEKVIDLFVAEIKLKQKSAECDRQIDIDAAIVKAVLGLAVSKKSYQGIVPSPIYISQYDAATDRVSAVFLPWLQSHNKKLHALFGKHVQQIAYWALVGENVDEVLAMLAAIDKRELHPYLRLAVLLRAEAISPGRVKGLLRINELNSFANTENIWQQILVAAVRSVITDNDFIELCLFYNKLFKYQPKLQAVEFKQILVKQAITELRASTNYFFDEKLEKLTQVAEAFDMSQLQQRVIAISERKKQCLKLLASIAKKSSSSKIIASINSKAEYRTHLLLIADICVLFDVINMPALYRHIKLLCENKKLTDFIDVAEVLQEDFDCECYSCKYALYESKIPMLSVVLELPSIKLPEVKEFCGLKQHDYTAISRKPVLSRSNPFELLGVDIQATKKDILQKVMQLSKQYPANMATYREAQSEIFDPAKRFLHHYLLYLSEDEVETQTEELVYA